LHGGISVLYPIFVLKRLHSRRFKTKIGFGFRELGITDINPNSLQRVAFAEGEGDAEGGAVVGDAVYGEGAFVGVDDLLGDRQS